jgi:hypothetical protein
MMLGALELLVLLLVGGLILGAVFGAGRRTRSRAGGGGFSLGHATLACPHCQQETRAGKPTCDHCGEDL